MERSIAESLELFPKNATILIDQMILYQRSGRPHAADSLADMIIKIDSSEAFPYAIKGLVAEGDDDTANAIKHYEIFIQKSLDTEPELASFRKRLNNLVVGQDSH